MAQYDNSACLNLYSKTIYIVKVYHNWDLRTVKCKATSFLNDDNKEILLHIEPLNTVSPQNYEHKFIYHNADGSGRKLQFL